ncbi:unnamed protein product [Cylindrotheca closterium]|uniref:Fascin n=1 Tax=Cylindrotheca closterium TaxID=2856 RepID=A0AAD2G8P3_9STRA|nr:unnamed protein product [Cylindrotheca closterium]
MITNAMEFPCVEATRCYIAEKEHGLRLCYNNHNGKKQKDDDSIVGTLSFTSSRGSEAEWYVHMETTSTHSFFHEETKLGQEERILQLAHCQTGHFLCVTSEGGVGIQAKPSKDTKWTMENNFATLNDDPDCKASFHLRSSLGKLLRITKSGQKKNKLIPEGFLSPAFLQGGLIPGTTCEYQVSTVDNDDFEDEDNSSAESSSAAVFELEFTSGELCFVSNPVLHSQIRCNPLGQLSLTQKSACQEVWRFIEVGNGGALVIATWSHAQTFYLSSDGDGNVFTTKNRLGHNERWKLERTENGARIVSVAHKGRYLSVGNDDGEALFRTTTQPNDYAKWHTEAAHSNTYHLQSIFVTSLKEDAPYISSDRKGRASLSKHKRDWEEWKLERFDDDYVTLYSKKHEQYLGSNSVGEVTTTKKVGEWSLWSIEQSTYGGIYLKSKTYQRRLAVVGEGEMSTLCTTKEQYSSHETWRLEPCLPFFLSPTKIAAMASAGVLGLALTVAMPYALLGIVEVGAAEAAGLTALRVLVGAGMVGTTGVCVVDTDPSAAMPSSPTAMEDYLVASCRPICAWQNW